MSYLSAQLEIHNRLKVEWASATPIAWPNVKFDRPEGNWIRLTVKEGNAYNTEIGNIIKTIRTPGVIYIQVFSKQGKGIKGPSDLAETLKLMFNNWCGDTVRCRAASVKDIGPDNEGFYQINVEVPYIRHELI